MSVLKSDFKKPVLGDGLVLYYHPYSLPSQKVLYVLHEKNIQFKSYVIDMANGEQFSPWFLNTSSSGDIPVLQDGCFIIPNSGHIINYIEQKYKKDAKTNIIPDDEKEYSKVFKYQSTLKQIPIGALSLGSFIHEDLKLNPKPPFVGPVKKACLNINEKLNVILRASVDENKSYSNSLLQKVALHEKRHQIISDREEFEKLLNSLKLVLIFMEEELKSNAEKAWLCSSEITIADITFGLILYRLYSLGFEKILWTGGHMPYIEKFLTKFMKTDSFQKSVPTSVENLVAFFSKAPANYKLGAGAVGVGAAVFAMSAFSIK